MPEGLLKPVRNTSALLAELTRLTQTSDKRPAVSYTDFTVGSHVLRSWKMNEWLYKEDPNPLPTRARGLFTEGDRIAVRGYDKFFNVDEVPWTKWDYLRTKVDGPFSLTVKSNGCIIFVAALSPSELVVTSKHSIGALEKEEKSHAEMGELWLDKHLSAANKSRGDLAARLWHDNLTVVTELCDDSFEEHVLPTPLEKTGLHLHGLNRNTVAFETLSCEAVDAFAAEFGFHTYPYATFDTMDAVKRYCLQVELSGGMTVGTTKIPVEGFVVRGLRYGEAFFFKYKYDEPYLLYRKWRELTRTILSHGEKGTLKNFDPNVIKDPRTRLYATWVLTAYKENPASFEPWAHGRGIVATRDSFFVYERETFGGVLRGTESQDKDSSLPQWEKVLLVPIAVPGSGKTVVAKAAVNLFGCAHIQSDNTSGKTEFINLVEKALYSNAVVFADRNNHLKQHREELLRAARQVYPTRVCKVALVWDYSQLGRRRTLDLCSYRIFSRGSSHQNLDASKDYNLILNRFMSQRQPFDVDDDLDGAAFDKVITVGHPEHSIMSIVHETIPKIAEIIQAPVPSAGAIDEAANRAPPDAPKPAKKEKNKRPVSYYAFVPLLNEGPFLLDHILDRLTRSMGFKRCGQRLPYEACISGERRRFFLHMTLVHRNAFGPEPDPVDNNVQCLESLWKDCERVLGETSDDAPERFAKLTLGPTLLFTPDFIGIQVSAVQSTIPSVVNADPREKASWHITMGTSSDSVRNYVVKNAFSAYLNDIKYLATPYEIEPFDVDAKLAAIQS